MESNVKSALTLKERDMVAKALGRPRPSDALVIEARKLWRAGCDTLWIATLLKVHESEIWNRLSEIRRAS